MPVLQFENELLVSYISYISWFLGVIRKVFQLKDFQQKFHKNQDDCLLQPTSSPVISL